MNVKNVSPLRNKETFLGTILLIVSAAVFIAVVRFPDTAARYRAIAPSVFPNLLAGALVILSVLLIIEGRRKAPAPIFDIKSERSNVIRAVGLIAVLVGFTAAFRYLGFVILSFLFTGGVQLLLGERRIFRVLLVATVVTGVLYMVFVVLLRVPLPRGIFR